MPHTNLRRGEERQYAACWGQPVKNCEQEKVEQDVQTPHSRIDLVNVQPSFYLILPKSLLGSSQYHNSANAYQKLLTH
jgi:hypothetical protein